MYIYVYKYILIRMYTLKECGDLKLRGLLLPCLHCRGEICNAILIPLLAIRS